MFDCKSWTFRGIGSVFVWLLASAFVAAFLPDMSSLGRDLDRLVTTGALITAGVSSTYAIFTVRATGFHPNWSRLSPSALWAHPGRCTSGALLLTVGLVLSGGPHPRIDDRCHLGTDRL